MKFALLRSRLYFVCVVALLAPSFAAADAAPKPQKAAIASQHELATQAGMEILKQALNTRFLLQRLSCSQTSTISTILSIRQHGQERWY